MPSFIEIQSEAGTPLDKLQRYIQVFESHTGRNAIIYYSGFLHTDKNTGIQDVDMSGFMNAAYNMDKSKGLDLFLHTPGGLVSTTEGIGDYLKSLFRNNINCYIPHMAMSCGTLLAMACQKIFMGKHSCLGPIDPAFGSYRAEAVVEEFGRAKSDIASNPNLALLWQPILGKYPMTFLGECEKASQLAGIVCEKWLRDCMLRNSSKKEELIVSIKRLFADHQNSKMHDRHISSREAKDAGLEISMIEDDDALQDAVMSVHHAAINYIRACNYARVVTNSRGQGWFVAASS